MTKIQAVRGMNDIFEPEIFLWQRVEESVRTVYQNFGFTQIRTPIVESTALFSRGVGTQTDIVEKEMYTFQDRNGESLSLRPEGTASVVRALIEHNFLRENSVAKFYYLEPMFRHERPQKGRYRQFFQYGVELVGVTDSRADAEVIAAQHVLYEKLDLDGIELRLSSVGCESCRPSYKTLLVEKLERVRDQLPIEFHPRIQLNPQRVFDLKDSRAEALSKELPVMLDHLCKDCQAHFEGLQKSLTLLRVPYVVDPKIVRGLDYYKKTAFEFLSGSLGAQSAVGGGGRYDGLFEQLGGKSVPAVGFAGGMERLILLLSQKQKHEECRVPISFFFVVPDEGSAEFVFALCHLLRSRGVACEMDLQSKSMKGQLRRADRLQAQYAVIIGSAEVEKKVAVLKNMKTQDQSDLPLEHLENHLLKIAEV